VLDVRLCVKLWYNDFKESALFVLGSCSSELGDLDRSVGASYVGLFHIRLEICDVGGAVIPMDIHKVDYAA
jgi:hypothetical protein